MTRARPRHGLDLIVRPERVEAALWRNALADPAALRGKLFSHYARFARAIAQDRFRAWRSGNFEVGDVEQLAYEGLLQAIDRFEPLRAIPFRAFARPRISGSISNGLGRFSEAAANAGFRRRAERDRLKSLIDAEKDDRDPVARLSRLAASLAAGLMLEEWRDEEIGQVGSNEPTAYETLEWKQTGLALRAGVESLPSNEAFIIRQHYLGGVSFRQIGAILGLSAGRVSQLHARALARLRIQMAKSG